MAQATTDISAFLPSVPKVPPARARGDGNQPARQSRSRRTTPNTPNGQTGVTATVTQARSRRRAAPPLAPAAPEEAPRQKFLRIGGGRMVNTLRSVRLLGNLANRAIYEWTDEDVALMRKAIDAQLDATFQKFAAKNTAERLEHTFHFEH